MHRTDGSQAKIYSRFLDLIYEFMLKRETSFIGQRMSLSVREKIDEMRDKVLSTLQDASSHPHSLRMYRAKTLKKT